MVEEQDRIVVSRALMPAYFKKFQCIGGRCRDNCCRQNWRITFTKRDYLTIKQAPKPPELQARVMAGMHRARKEQEETRYAEFDTSGGVCGLLTEEGFCALQMACGGAVLPAVCRDFPRRRTYTAAGKECSLSPACEAVLELLYDLPGGIDFLEEPLPPAEARSIITSPDKRYQLYFPEVRSFCVDTLQDRRFPLAQRMVLLGFALDDLRGRMARGVPDVERWRTGMTALLERPEALPCPERTRESRVLCLTNNLKFLLEVKGKPDLATQILQDAQVAVVPEGVGKSRVNIPVQDYLERYEASERALTEGLGELEYFYENLAVSLLFYLNYPRLDSPEELWKSYANLCCCYSFLRFFAVAGCVHDSGKAQLFHALVKACRCLIHSGGNQNTIQDDLFQNDSATLAHLAVLVNG